MTSPGTLWGSSFTPQMGPNWRFKDRVRGTCKCSRHCSPELQGWRVFASALTIILMIIIVLIIIVTVVIIIVVITIIETIVVLIIVTRRRGDQA